MSVKVIAPGLLTTIQDTGRTGYAEYGVPVSGAMDQYTAKIANLLVGNSADKALLEITMLGPKLEFQQEALIALTGLAAELEVNGEAAELNTAFNVTKNDRLQLKKVTSGIRVYLAVHGGFLTPKLLGSRCFYKGISPVEKLRRNMNLPLAMDQPRVENEDAAVKVKAEPYNSAILKVNKGPEWTRLPKHLQDKIGETGFTVSKNNSRMAYQLQEKIPNKLSSMLTQPVLPGTVQLTPAGNLIILMRDSQTTGGYPRILQLSPKSINRLAQKKRGEDISFEISQ